ncbi:MAG: lytic transglycosylase domain-containing protein, partial [Gammaproteobacteria bacterium]|nr:lytic transglycosylase domain-containing protein [Gammaproteobacteria bacterium]
KYLKYLLGLFKDDLSLTIAAYNAGENAVKKYNNQIPPYPETQNYVKQVLNLYKKDQS